jgi:hypothetical protein
MSSIQSCKSLIINHLQLFYYDLRLMTKEWESNKVTF